MNKRKQLAKLLAGSTGIRFAEAVSVAESVGFELKRTSGSHHILSCKGIPELLNLQDVKGEAKPYQVRQLVKLIEKYNLQIQEAE